jgi:hypothetical protein
MPDPARVKAALLAGAGKSSEVLITRPVAREAAAVLLAAYETACAHADMPMMQFSGEAVADETAPSAADLERWIKKHLPCDADGRPRYPGPVTGELAPGRLAKFLAREGLTLDDVELTAITYPWAEWVGARYAVNSVPVELRPRSAVIARLPRTHSLVVYARSTA